MKVYLKICENEKCGEIMGCFPRKKCQFCESTKFSTHHVQMRLVLGGYSAYADENRSMGVIRDYLGVDHLVIRTIEGDPEGNDCDSNGGYIHVVDIDDVDYMEKLINMKITKEGNYL